MKSLKFCFAALIVLAMCTASALAQSTTTGAIGGTVTDQKKAVVPGATVTVKNTATNKEDTGTTDGEGRFKIPNLQPGDYTVTTNASGFAAAITPNVVVEVGRETTLDLGLSIQGVGATVEVTSVPPVINTTQQDFSTNMNQTSINELPINGQRWSNFALLTPGTVPDGNFGLISFRGISGLLNNNTVDGGDNNQGFFSEERGRTRINYVISQSAIREFQVNTSNYSAEYGRAAGGVTNAVTKSGSNNFHGDAFFYDRDNRWGARNPLATRTTFDPTTGLRTVTGIKPTDKRYRFGGDIGGPIKKDKAFFFFNYDELRRNFPGLAIFSNPSYTVPLFQGGTLNTCVNVTNPTPPPATIPQAGCTATNVTNSLKNPTTRNLSDAQINSVLSFLNSETGPNVRNGNQRIFMPKVDWNINSKNTLTGTYNRLRWASISGIQTQPTNNFGVTSFGDDFVNDDSVNIRLSSNISSNLINEARYQWSRDNEFEFSKTPLAGEPLTAPAYPGIFAAGSRGPDVSLTGGGGLEFGVATFLERTKFPFETRNQFFDMITMTKGSHTFKLGGDYNHLKDVADNLRFYAGAYTFNNLNDFIIDYLNWKTPGGLLNPAGTAPMTCSGSSRTAGRCYSGNYQQAFGGTVFTLTTNAYNFFGQDDWRVTPRFTLNLGLRWEYQQFPKPFIANPAIPQTGVMPSDKNNFGPRLGFAWDVKGDGKDSIRGGYGIYYGLMGSSTIYNALINTGMPGGQFSTSTSPTCSGTLPASCNGITAPIFPNTLAAPTAPAVAVQFFQRGFQMPTIHQADVVYEHEIARNTVISGSLLMSFGKNLPNYVDTNLNPPSQTFNYTVVGGPFDGKTYTVPWFYGTSRPNPAFAAMTEIRSNVWSKYVGGVVQLNRRLTKGLQFQMNYTRSSARDTNQTSQTFTTANVPFNAFDQSGEAGRSFVDVPNKFIANAVWQPQFKNPILKDWTISPIFAAYSGIPLSTFVSGSIPAPGPSQDASTCWPGTVTSNQCNTPSGGQNGSGGSARFIQLPRNFHRLPRIINTDLRVSRRFRFTESTALEVLVEGFNIFNRTQVTGQNNTYYSISTATTSACLAAHTTCTVNGVAGVPFNAATNTATLTYQTSFQTTNAAGGTIFRERQVQFAVRFQF